VFSLTIGAIAAFISDALHFVEDGKQDADLNSETKEERNIRFRTRR
jgi:hypothetical protein